MAVVDFCTENSSWASPRISFSCYLIQNDGTAGVPADRCRTEPSSLKDKVQTDFDFCMSRRPDHESPSADELFSEGKIVPLQFKDKPPRIRELPPSTEKKKGAVEDIMVRGDGSPVKSLLEKEKRAAGGSRSSFWPFGRSSSLNSGDGHRRRSIWPRQILARSNSSGSADSNTKHGSSKPESAPHKNSDSNPRSPPLTLPSTSPNSLLQKPPLKKETSTGRTRHGSYANGIRMGPVLNVPPPYISNGATNLLGFGYLFSRKETKTTTKKFFFSRGRNASQEERKRGNYAKISSI